MDRSPSLDRGDGLRPGPCLLHGGGIRRITADACRRDDRRPDDCRWCSSVRRCGGDRDDDVAVRPSAAGVRRSSSWPGSVVVRAVAGHCHGRICHAGNEGIRPTAHRLRGPGDVRCRQRRGVVPGRHPDSAEGWRDTRRHHRKLGLVRRLAPGEPRRWRGSSGRPAPTGLRRPLWHCGRRSDGLEREPVASHHVACGLGLRQLRRGQFHDDPGPDRNRHRLLPHPGIRPRDVGRGNDV